MFNIFQKVCRVCMSESSELIPIWNMDNAISSTTFSKSNPSSPKEVMLNEFTKFQASIDDGLPKNVCIDCLVDMEHAFAFKKKCERSDIRLRTHLKLIEHLPKDSSIRDPLSLDEWPLQVNYEEIAYKSHECEIIDAQLKVQDEEISVAYQCFECSTQFSSNIEIERHIINEHQQPTSSGQLKVAPPLLNCGLCPAEFTQMASLEQHRQSHPILKVEITDFLGDVNQTTVTKAFCNDCHTNFASKRILNFHKRMVHKMPNQVGVQKSVANGKKLANDIKFNLRRQNKRLMVVCNFCSKSFPLHFTSMDHSGNECVKCSDCSAAGFTKRDAGSYIRVSSEAQGLRGFSPLTISENMLLVSFNFRNNF